MVVMFLLVIILIGYFVLSNKPATDSNTIIIQPKISLDNGKIKESVTKIAQQKKSKIAKTDKKMSLDEAMMGL